MVNIDINIISSDGVKVSGGYSDGSIDVELSLDNDEARKLIVELIEQLNKQSVEKYELVKTNI